jgi:CCR4-NOT transcription complex subunit 4
MEDSDFLCPLCCEELDISDRNFYPCKCGYQVCMWCWHRIRESESGLCPACRTPYGDDPHEFSAVDVEEVLRVNKEKAAAEKKTSVPKEAVVLGEDRTALANMRVIRRNLVYAVGLPPLPEEILRKAEYFGQYGKISKIVLNRNNPPAGDARRASASAYVTFVHKVRYCAHSCFALAERSQLLVCSYVRTIHYCWIHEALPVSRIIYHDCVTLIQRW